MAEKKIGRPRKEIDQENFEKLCAMQSTLEEIAGFYDCSEDTIERWCERTYGERFADVFARKRAGGRISLRRKQWNLANHNASMAIFLGKQYLGQKDVIEERVEVATDGFLEALTGQAPETFEKAEGIVEE